MNERERSPDDMFDLWLNVYDDENNLQGITFDHSRLRLWKTAPKLLEACKAALKFVNLYANEEACKTATILGEAIAEAEGKDSERSKDPYAKCESFSDVCKTFMEVDPQMKKFFGNNKDGE